MSLANSTTSAFVNPRKDSKILELNRKPNDESFDQETKQMLY
jgi:hypothetical protein